MSRDEHRAAAGSAEIRVHVLVVSSTRTLDTDQSGPAIAAALAAAGHAVADRAIVDDDAEAIRAAVRERVAGGAAAIVLTGGTGITGRDVTPEALAPLLSPRLDGFGELFRMLSFEEIGAAAMLSRAVAGLCGRTVVFAVPGSRAACRLAVERLIAPELAHLVHLAATDRGAAAPAAPVVEDAAFEPTEVAPPAVAGARVGVSGPSDAVAPSHADGPWQALLSAWGGALAIESREPLPESIEQVAPVMDVLQRAGRAAALTLADGRRYSVWGFPDLVRPSSKVLAIRDAGERAEVLALHRWPTETGTVVPGGRVGHGDPNDVAERVTGRRPPTPLGPLFAVTGGATLHLSGSRVVRWDGRKEREEGNVKQCLASLVLDWTTR